MKKKKTIIRNLKLDTCCLLNFRMKRKVIILGEINLLPNDDGERAIEPLTSTGLIYRDSCDPNRLGADCDVIGISLFSILF